MTAGFEPYKLIFALTLFVCLIVFVNRFFLSNAYSFKVTLFSES